MTAARVIVLAVAVIAVVPSALGGDALDALAGKALFERVWIAAPSSTVASDGLGPHFSARSCASCHAQGGGSQIETDANGGQRMTGAVVRLGTTFGAPDPYYGIQLQTGAVPGLTPEARITVWPALSIAVNGPPLVPAVNAGLRVAPQLWGVADFETVPDAEILSRADPDDTDGDGISGRPRIVGDRIGRYGWKAQNATLDSQIAQAFAIDLGLSSALQPFASGDCTHAQIECRGAPNGESSLANGYEISDDMISLVADYIAALRGPALAVQADGERIFLSTGCARCHVPELKSARGTPVRAYTDLLLHDMGPELDDGVGEPRAASIEWRTAPLKRRYRHGAPARYLHNGSAASVAEAIAKHGGEASASRLAFGALDDNGKRLLIEFVGGQNE